MGGVKLELSPAASNLTPWGSLFFSFCFLFYFSHFLCLQAFGKAWMEACSSKDSVLVVPENRNYYLKPITFSGPCESNFIMKVSSMHACMLSS
jgi:hypothetical protein